MGQLRDRARFTIETLTELRAFGQHGRQDVDGSYLFTNFRTFIRKSAP